VFAAASLKAPFTEIGKRFEAAHDDTTVRFNFAGSSDLVAQTQNGAPADVLALADIHTMDQAQAAGIVDGRPHAFAANTLVIVTPPDNPARIDSLRDLSRDSTKVVMCAPAVPCGAAALRVEKMAGIDIEPVSEEQSVTDVLGKVVSGEADAGLVYVTDARAAGDSVHSVPFAESAQVVNTYPIATVRRGHDLDLARHFVDYVRGTEGQDVLASAGFGKP
jgi:molybdate transport system substrate-binding protein